MVKTLENILGDREMSEFSKNFVETSRNSEQETYQTYCILRYYGLSKDKIASQAHLLGFKPETIQRNYENLVEIGLKDSKIASNASLLGLNPETIQRNYENLVEIGLKDSKIATHASLLGRDPETIQRNYENLVELGLKDSKIASQAHLLGRDPETIQRNYENLVEIGLKDSQIASQAHLLGLNPETIQRNYENSISLLRDNYQDRNSGRKLSLNLLRMKQETCENNIQFLDRLGIDYNKNLLLLGTTAKKKREKMAWLLKNCFDYSEKPVEDRKETINQMYDLVRTNPSYLIKSINSLESSKDKIRKKIHGKQTN